MRSALVQIALLMGTGWLASYVALAAKAKPVAGMLRLTAIFSSAAVVITYVHNVGTTVGNSPVFKLLERFVGLLERLL